MAKKKDKVKKKLSAKKEKYAKFHKEKAPNMNLTSPELTPEQQKQKQQDELKINSFLRYSKNRPTLSIREKRAKGKNR
jgi:hypothetical protein